MNAILKSLRNRLPAWARPDHPIAVREMDRLPYLSFHRRSPAGRILVGLMVLVTPCALFFGNIPIQIILLPLSFLTLNWSAPLLGQERRDGTWDSLRLTPYSTQEIVLAKLSAAGRRLGGLLGVLEVGQIASLMAVGLYILMFNARSGYRVFSGAWVQHPAFTGAEQGAIVAAGVGLVGVSLLIPFLDFALTIVLGALASTWTERHESTVIWAILLRAVLLVAFLASGAILIQLATGEQVNPLMIFGGALMGGPIGWTFLGIYDWPWAALATALALLMAEVLALLVALRLTIWRAERL